MSHNTIVDAATGQTIEREPTPEEIAERTTSPAELLAEEQAEAERNRHAAYIAESDPLFFEWQRGDGTEQAWRDKVAEIKVRYPYPTAP
jgi:hypothetical protein